MLEVTHPLNKWLKILNETPVTQSNICLKLLFNELRTDDWPQQMVYMINLD